jgi:hypothetical protein
MAPSNGQVARRSPPCITTCGTYYYSKKHVVPLFNFTTNVHTNRLFELSQHLIKISHGIKILMYLAFNIDFRIYLILIKFKIDQIQLSKKKLNVHSFLSNIFTESFTDRPGLFLSLPDVFASTIFWLSRISHVRIPCFLSFFSV